MSGELSSEIVALRAAHEIRLINYLKEKLESCLEELSRDYKLNSEERMKLHREGYRLLDIAQKALLKRQIMINLENLGKEQTLLSALNEKYHELSRMRTELLSIRSSSLNNKYETHFPTYNNSKIGNQLYEELRKLREELYKTLTSQDEKEK